VATNGAGLRRQLFADDAAQGFAFVDICRKHFDVILMNPPFGESSKPSKAYIERAYPRTKNDVYSAFIERCTHLLNPQGRLGAITSRAGFYLNSFRKFREEILLKEAPPNLFADLGSGVLDTAMVEVAAYCLERK
jgi:tRNA1(Val) A37 N6-methylase TrmN6